MTVKTPEPLPEWTARAMQDGRFTEEFYRYLLSVDAVVRAAVAFVNTPVPDPQIELVEDWPVLVPFAADKDYVLIQNNQVERTITETVTDCDSGTCTATFKINSTALGGTANSVSSTEQSQAHASDNVLGVGDDLVMVLSANSDCVELRANVKTTRTITAT